MSQYLSALEQDRAAGGIESRKLRIRSGDVVVVSLAISGTGSRTPHGVVMRFKSGGSTISRPVGKVEGESRFEILKKGWAKVKDDRIAEQNGWEWVAK